MAKWVYFFHHYHSKTNHLFLLNCPMDYGIIIGGQTRYKIIKKIGGGAMGIVYLCQNLENGQEVAIKDILPQTGENIFAWKQKNFGEAKTLTKLEGNTHVIQIFNVIANNDNFYLVMEYFPSQNLADYLRQYAPSPETALKICQKVALGLNFIHNHGIIHRDLKPQNILIGSNESVKIVDFGIAKDLKDVYKTFTTAGWGSPPYMSPEQIEEAERNFFKGKNGNPEDLIGPWSDLYSLGLILYEMVYNNSPFKSLSQAEILSQKRKSGLPFQVHLSPTLLFSRQHELKLLIEDLIQNDRTKRLQTAESLVTRLQSLLTKNETSIETVLLNQKSDFSIQGSKTEKPDKTKQDDSFLPSWKSWALKSGVSLILGGVILLVKDPLYRHFGDWACPSSFWDWACPSSPLLLTLQTLHQEIENEFIRMNSTYETLMKKGKTVRDRLNPEKLPIESLNDKNIKALEEDIHAFNSQLEQEQSLATQAYDNLSSKIQSVISGGELKFLMNDGDKFQATFDLQKDILQKAHYKLKNYRQHWTAGLEDLSKEIFTRWQIVQDGNQFSFILISLNTLTKEVNDYNETINHTSNIVPEKVEVFLKLLEQFQENQIEQKPNVTPVQNLLTNVRSQEKNRWENFSKKMETITTQAIGYQKNVIDEGQSNQIAAALSKSIDKSQQLKNRMQDFFLDLDDQMSIVKDRLEGCHYPDFKPMVMAMHLLLEKKDILSLQRVSNMTPQAITSLQKFYKEAREITVEHQIMEIPESKPVKVRFTVKDHFASNLNREFSVNIPRREDVWCLPQWGQS